MTYVKYNIRKLAFVNFTACVCKINAVYPSQLPLPDGKLVSKLKPCPSNPCLNKRKRKCHSFVPQIYQVMIDITTSKNKCHCFDDDDVIIEHDFSAFF